VIPLARPVIGAREEELVIEALRSRRLGLGPMLPEFEAGLSALLGGAPVSAVSSGTAGLHLAIRACGARAGDEVVTTPFSFVASANCLLYEDVRPVFCDIDPRTLNITPEAAAAAVGERTTGLLPVHIFGYPLDMGGFERLASERGLWLVEDACEALGAVHADGKPVGARGNAAVFGFYPNKQLTTGEGGAITTDDPDAARELRSLVNQGRTDNGDWLVHQRLGFNYRMDEMSAAVGMAQLEKLDMLLDRRRRIAARYDELLAGIEGVETPYRGSEPRSWFIYYVRLAPEIDRAAVSSALADRGVATRPYLPAIHLQPTYRERFAYGPGMLPVTERVSASTLALPFYVQLEDDDIAYVANALREVLAEQ
jgi:perosamine synthetase